MKKFTFSLETMLGYQLQVLEAKQQEYAVAQGLALEQEVVVHALKEEYRSFDEEFNRKKLEGMTVIDAITREGCLQALEKEVKKELVKLRKLEAEAEEKRQEMILAKQDTSSAEKLREKKLEDYNKAVTKEEEAMIDELVAATWSMNRQAVQ